MLRCLRGQRILCVPSAGVTLVGWNLNEVSNYHVSAWHDVIFGMLPVSFVQRTPWSILELWLCRYGDGFSMIWRIYSFKFLFHLLYFEFCDLLIWVHINDLEPYLRSELWYQTISVNKYNVFICKKYKEQEYIANIPQEIFLHFGETELLFVQYVTRQHIYIPQLLWPPRLDSGLKITHFKTGRVVQWQCSNCRKQCAWSEWKSARKGSSDYCHLHEVVYLLHSSLWTVCFHASINHRVSEKSTLAHNSPLSVLSTYRPETTS